MIMTNFYLLFKYVVTYVVTFFFPFVKLFVKVITAIGHIRCRNSERNSS